MLQYFSLAYSGHICMNTANTQSHLTKQLLTSLTITTLSPQPSPSGKSSCSSQDNLCWICFDTVAFEDLTTGICACKSRYVHLSCLKKWHHFSSKEKNFPQNKCPACNTMYTVSLGSGESKHQELPCEADNAVSTLFFLQNNTTAPHRLSNKWHCLLLSLSTIFGYVFFLCRGDLLGECTLSVIFNFVIGFAWFFASSSATRVFSKIAFYMDVLLLFGCYTVFVFGIALASFNNNQYIFIYSKNSLCGHAINFCCLISFTLTRKCQVLAS